MQYSSINNLKKQFCSNLYFVCWWNVFKNFLGFLRSNLHNAILLTIKADQLTILLTHELCHLNHTCKNFTTIASRSGLWNCIHVQCHNYLSTWVFTLYDPYRLYNLYSWVIWPIQILYHYKLSICHVDLYEHQQVLLPQLVAKGQKTLKMELCGWGVSHLTGLRFSLCNRKILFSLAWILL